MQGGKARKGKQSRVVCPNTGRAHVFTSTKQTNGARKYRICSYCTAYAPGQGRT